MVTLFLRLELYRQSGTRTSSILGIPDGTEILAFDEQGQLSSLSVTVDYRRLAALLGGENRGYTPHVANNLLPVGGGITQAARQRFQAGGSAPPAKSAFGPAEERPAVDVGFQAAGRPTKKPKASNGSQKQSTTKPGGGGPLPAGEPLPKGRRAEEAVGHDCEKRPHPSRSKATAPRAVSRGSSCGDPGPTRNCQVVPILAGRVVSRASESLKGFSKITR